MKEEIITKENEMKVKEQLMLEGTKADIIEYFEQKFKDGTWRSMGESIPHMKIETQLDNNCKSDVKGKDKNLPGKIGTVSIMIPQLGTSDTTAPEITFKFTLIWVRLLPESNDTSFKEDAIRFTLGIFEGTKLHSEEWIKKLKGTKLHAEEWIKKLNAELLCITDDKK